MRTDEDFRWPPPGLERLQGDLWRVVRSGWLAGALLVLPLLLLTTISWDLATLGPLADSWWVAVALASVGLAFAIDTFARLARLAQRGTRAVASGYDARTLLAVVADRSQDMGFLLQGARHYSVLSVRARETLVSLRLLTPVLLAGAGVWLCLSFAAGLVVAARGWVGPEVFRAVTLVPATGLYFFGLVTSLTDDARVRRARRIWHAGSWEDDLDPESIRAWRESLPATVGQEDGRVAPVRALRRFGIASGVAAVLVLIPVLFLIPASAIGPMLANVSSPQYVVVQRRAAELEVYRIYRVTPDPSVTPAEAGRLLQNLAYVGATTPAPPGELEPPLRIEESWLPETPAPEEMGPPELWHDRLFGLAAAGPGAESRSYLATVASHRARADFSRLARALRLDAASARWQDPWPEELTRGSVPAPRLFGVREGARAHLAAAAAELLRGRAELSETLAREVLSVGFLLADQGPTLIDNLVGLALIREGGLALERLFEATGRSEQASELSAARATGVRAASRIHTSPARSPEALARLLPELVLDSGTVRGLAWESFALMATLAPCMNLNRVVFGPGQDYERFVDQARQALVRWPSEEGLFRLAAAGLFERPAADGLVPARLLKLSVRSGRGSCGEVLDRFIGPGGGPGE